MLAILQQTLETHVDVTPERITKGLEIGELHEIKRQRGECGRAITKVNRWRPSERSERRFGIGVWPPHFVSVLSIEDDRVEPFSSTDTVLMTELCMRRWVLAGMRQGVGAAHEVVHQTAQPDCLEKPRDRRLDGYRGSRTHLATAPGEARPGADLQRYLPNPILRPTSV